MNELYEIDKIYYDIADALDIRKEVDSMLETIASAKPEPISFSHEPVGTRSWVISTPYGNKIFWKNVSEDFLRVGDGHIQAMSIQESEKYTKMDLIRESLIDLIKGAAYTGVSYGIGGDEYTEKGKQAEELLKEAGFYGI